MTVRNRCVPALCALMFSAAAPAQGIPDWFGVDGFELFTPPTAFRMLDLDLRDPHVFMSLAPFPGCADFTDNPIPFTTFSFNGQIATGFNSDTDPADGILDLSNLFLFRPLRQDGRVARVDSVSGDCAAPSPPASCAPRANSVADAFVYAAAASGTCLAPVAGTLGTPAYSPAITTPSGPCFATAAKAVQFNNAGTPVTLQDAQYAASLTGNPATGLASGLMRGFVSEAIANATVITNPTNPAQTFTLASLLPGGTGNCSARNDKDIHRGVSGWWFYLNFHAAPVSYSGQ